MNTLLEEVKKSKEKEYKSFVEKYGARIDEKIKSVFIEQNRSHWNVGVYDDKRRGTLEGDIYYDKEVNGGRFNNLVRYAKEKGFTTTKYYWCGGACVDADGFRISL